MKTKEFAQNFSGFAKISTREIQFFSKKNLPRKLVPAKISTIKVVIKCRTLMSLITEHEILLLLLMNLNRLKI